jgi:ABC-2 type transport system ATP-binding protein
VTVFLTTQYLEEADALADRVGIIDHGRIVAEGTPAELKAAIGRPSVEAVPHDPGEREQLATVLARFGEAAAAGSNGVAVQLPRGAGDLAEIVRAIDAENLRVADLRLHSPTLDDVFLAKTGRSLEGAAEEDDEGADGKGAGGPDRSDNKGAGGPGSADNKGARGPGSADGKGARGPGSADGRDERPAAQPLSG